jgi:hypothetical protein
MVLAAGFDNTSVSTNFQKGPYIGGKLDIIIQHVICKYGLRNFPFSRSSHNLQLPSKGNINDKIFCVFDYAQCHEDVSCNGSRV